MSEQQKKEATQVAKDYAQLKPSDKQYIKGMMAGMIIANNGDKKEGSK